MMTFIAGACTCYQMLTSLTAIGLVTHRFLECKKCGKVTSHRYDLVNGGWRCMICGELREESEDYLLSPDYSPESIKDIIRAIIWLVLVFVLAYALMLYVMPLW